MRKIMKKSKLLMVMLLVIALVSAAVLLIACEKKPPVVTPPESKSFNNCLTDIGAAMDQSFSFNASRQLAVDMDFDLSYKSNNEAGPDWKYKLVLKGNISLGTETQPNDQNDLLLSLQKGDGEEIFRISLYEDKIYLRYGVEGEDDYRKLVFTNAPVFSAIKNLLNGVDPDTGTIDLTTALKGAGIFESLLPLIGSALFDPDTYEWVDSGIYQTLTLDFSFKTLKEALPGLLGLIGSDIDLESIITPILDMIPDVSTKVIFTLKGSKFVKVEIKDASVNVNNGEDEGVFNFKSNSLSIENGLTTYDKGLEPLPEDYNEYEESKFLTIDLEGKIYLHDEAGAVYGWLNYKIAGSVDLFEMINQYFDLSSETLRDNFLHIELWYENTYDETLQLQNDAWGAQRFEASNRTNELRENAKTSLLDIIWDPSSQLSNPGAILIQFNLSNLITDASFAGIKDMILEEGKFGILEIDTWTMIGPSFLNNHTIYLDPYAMLYPDKKDFADLGASSANALQQYEMFTAASAQMLSSAAGGFDLGSIIGMVLPMLMPDPTIYMEGNWINLLTKEDGDTAGTGLINLDDGLALGLDSLYEFAGRMDLGEDMPIDLVEVIKGIFQGKVSDAETGTDTVITAKTLTLGVDVLDLWTKADETFASWVAPGENNNPDGLSYPYYHAFREPDGREKLYAKGEVLGLLAAFREGIVQGSPINSVSLTGNNGFATFFGYDPTSLSLNLTGEQINAAKILDQGSSSSNRDLKYLSLEEFNRLAGSYVQVNYNMSRGNNTSNFVKVTGYDGLDMTRLGEEQEITLFLNVVESNGILSFLNNGEWVNVYISKELTTFVDPILGDTPLELTNYRVTTRIIVYENLYETPSEQFNERHPEQSTFIKGVQALDSEIQFAENVSKTVYYNLGLNNQTSKVVDLADISLYRFMYPEKVSDTGMAIGAGENVAYITINGIEYSCAFTVTSAIDDVITYQMKFDKGPTGEAYKQKENYEYTLSADEEFAHTDYVVYAPVGWKTDSESENSFGEFEVYSGSTKIWDSVLATENFVLYDENYNALGVSNRGKDYDFVPEFPYDKDDEDAVGIKYLGRPTSKRQVLEFTKPGTYILRMDRGYNDNGAYWFSVDPADNGSGDYRPTPGYGITYFFFKLVILEIDDFAYQTDGLNVEFTGSSAAEREITVDYELSAVGSNVDATNHIELLINNNVVENGFKFNLGPDNFDTSEFKKLAFGYNLKGKPEAAGYYNLTITVTTDTGQTFKLYKRGIEFAASGQIEGEWQAVPNTDSNATFKAWLSGGLTEAYLGITAIYKKISDDSVVTSDNVSAYSNGNKVGPSGRFIAGRIDSSDSTNPTVFDLSFLLLKPLDSDVYVEKVTAYLLAGDTLQAFANAEILEFTANATAIRPDENMIDFAFGSGSVKDGGGTSKNGFETVIYRNPAITADGDVRVNIVLRNNEDTADVTSTITGNFTVNGSGSYGLNSLHEGIILASDASFNNITIKSTNIKFTAPSQAATYKLFVEVIINDVLYYRAMIRSHRVSACVAEGTLITLADGSQVPVETLKGGEMLLVWNLFTGTFDVAPAVFVDSEPPSLCEIVTLYFSDGTTVKVIDEHGFWDFDLNEYVAIRNDAAKYIGHWFNKQVVDGDGKLAYTSVQLTDVIITEEYTTAWSPVTLDHVCFFVNGMLSMPGDVQGFYNFFEVDPETMTYDIEAMEADIAEYGLFTYEELNDIFPLPKVMFDSFPFKYLKISIGKGLITMEKLGEIITRYVSYME